MRRGKWRTEGEEDGDARALNTRHSPPASAPAAGALPRSKHERQKNATPGHRFPNREIRLLRSSPSLSSSSLKTRRRLGASQVMRLGLCGSAACGEATKVAWAIGSHRRQRGAGRWWYTACFRCAGGRAATAKRKQQVRWRQRGRREWCGHERRGNSGVRVGENRRACDSGRGDAEAGSAGGSSVGAGRRRAVARMRRQVGRRWRGTAASCAGRAAGGARRGWGVNRNGVESVRVTASQVVAWIAWIAAILQIVPADSKRRCELGACRLLNSSAVAVDGVEEGRRAAKVMRRRETGGDAADHRWGRGAPPGQVNE
ncbi:hypothetical protein DFH08DRAFT_817892 [Mycena albidolilacea]|uniref:Uncharacterized protein n=1 Tax=Mycena albidolilacea TaxID=1033008 RepID=A0AAD6ZI86_9AGAR|nr:hypothetical protein DFH08DRAFT_817892 [Mycena albidolilacea]